MQRIALAIVVILSSGCSPQIPGSLHTLAPIHSQAIVVRTSHSKAQLSLWQKVHDHWQKKYMTIPAMIGKNGLALKGEKKEGDGKTPSGIYNLKTAFGYYLNLRTGLDYRQVERDDLWIDDSKSSQYNQWVKAPTLAQSYEKLRREDQQYKLAAVIEYNTDPIIPGNGSAIFLHIWKRYDHPTAGCVAVSERHLRKILAILEKSHKPVIILENNGQ